MRRLSCICQTKGERERERLPQIQVICTNQPKFNYIFRKILLPILRYKIYSFSGEKALVLLIDFELVLEMKQQQKGIKTSYI